MAGACCKCTSTLSAFKRSLSVAPRGCSSAPRYQLACWRLGERGLQEASRATSAVRPAGFYRHTASVCLSCQESMSESLRTCYVYLNQTSRSFAAVIQALDGELRWVTRRLARTRCRWGGVCLRRSWVFSQRATPGAAFTVLPPSSLHHCCHIYFPVSTSPWGLKTPKK